MTTQSSFTEKFTAWLVASPFPEAPTADHTNADSEKDIQMPPTEPIPGPPGLPIVGNIFDIDAETPLKTLENFADTYGEIFVMRIAGKDAVFVSSHALVDELCDEKRFSKQVSSALQQVRNGTGDGLFTAYTGEENWSIAHRILIPAFGPLSIRSMFDEMADLANQLALKWARQPPSVPIDVSEDFTRLTLDTIALCAMGARFNSFYTEHLHPFVDAMVRFLVESGNRGRRLPFMNAMMSKTTAQYFGDVEYMKKVAMDLVEERRQNPTDKRDLLNAMLLGKDPKSGKGLSDEMIANNMITFLIAGHETTSGTLSFAMHNLLKQPRTYKALQEEVDRVIGREKVTVEHLANLPYMNAVLRETLRLTSPIPAIAFRAHPFENHEEHVIIGGKYEVAHDQTIFAVINKMHKDPKVYGSDANEFRPERMLQEDFDKLPKNAWKPFGNGARACIGRPFAWQEMLLVLAILFQNFDFELSDSGYKLAIKQTLTIKPKGFQVKARLREGVTPISLQATLGGSHVDQHHAQKPIISTRKSAVANGSGSQKPMYIYYGSNTGTCEAFAGRLASDAVNHGYKARVDTLDSATNRLSTDGPVIIITASYEGQPPDNAARFFEWLSDAKGEEAKGVRFAVFGCGHHDWQATFQRIPTEINKKLEQIGGERLCERGAADAAAGDMFTDFDNWEEHLFWPSLGDAAQVQEASANISRLDVSVRVETRPSTLGQSLKTGLVIENKLITTPDVPEKRHIEIKLPSDFTYKVGDYLAVLPTNPPSQVRRAMRRFGLPWDATLTIESGMPTTLPTNVAISAGDLFSSYVELSQPATKRDLVSIADSSEDDDTKQSLLSLANDSKRFNTEISQLRVSPLDILEKYPKVQLRIGDFLTMLPPMRIRQYSISSSPLANAENCTLTYSVLSAPHSAEASHKHLGVASNYLASLEAGDNIQVSVRTSHGGFHLPLDVGGVPIIMIAAGTGLAPFRGFIMERAAQIAADRRVSPALLFFGCRSPGKDDLYAEQLLKWSAMGAVDVRYAFSRDANESHGCRHVQDRLWLDRDNARQTFDAGGKVYVCGSREVGAAVKETCKKIYAEAAEKAGKPKSEEDMEAWFNGLGKERYATDVFA